MVANVQAVARSLLWMCTVLASTVASVAWAAGTEPAADPRAPTPQASTPLPLLTPKSYLESLATFKTHL